MKYMESSIFKNQCLKIKHKSSLDKRLEVKDIKLDKIHGLCV